MALVIQSEGQEVVFRAGLEHSCMGDAFCLTGMALNHSRSLALFQFCSVTLCLMLYCEAYMIMC